MKLSAKLIESIDEIASILEEDDISIGSYGLHVQNYVKNSDIASIKRIARNFIAYFDYDDAFDKASKGKLVIGESKTFLEHSIRARFTDSYGASSMYLVKECTKPVGVSFVFQKDSWLTDIFNLKLMSLNEGG